MLRSNEKHVCNITKMLHLERAWYTMEDLMTNVHFVYANVYFDYLCTLSSIQMCEDTVLVILLSHVHTLGID